MDMETAEKMSVFFRYYDLPVGFPVVALLGNGWRSTAETVTRLHFHNCVEIGFLCEGSCKLILEGETIALTSPAVTVLPPNKPHYTQAFPEEDNRWNWIYLDPARLLKDFDPVQMNELHRYLRLLNGQDCVFTQERTPEIIQMVRIVLRELEEKKTHYRSVARGLFSSLFLMLFRQTVDKGDPVTGEQAHQPGRIAAAITYINENYMNNITVDQLADICHVSVTHLRRLFHQSLGWSPQEYLHIVRIGHACDILFGEECSVTDVAIRVGYSAPSSLTRQFRRLYGISPNQWRKKARREDNPEVSSYLRAMPKPE